MDRRPASEARRSRTKGQSALSHILSRVRWTISDGTNFRPGPTACLSGAPFSNKGPIRTKPYFEPRAVDDIRWDKLSAGSDGLPQRRAVLEQRANPHWAIFCFCFMNLPLVRIGPGKNASLQSSCKPQRLSLPLRKHSVRIVSTT